jgi:hypothetical protein
MSRKPPKPSDLPPSPRFIKKSPKRSIHDLSRDIGTDLNQLEEIWEELEKGPHRVAGIMAAASLEHALEYAITQRFSQISRRKPTEFESLFRYPKFLSSFGAKIEIGYAIGIYGELVRNDLDTVRAIRNAFAHSKVLIDFATPEVADEVRKLRFLDWMTTSGIIEAADEIARKRAASDNALRFDFVFIVRTLTHYIFTNFVPPFEPTTLP